MAGVVLVSGFPWDDGKPYPDLLEVKDGVMPYPGWGPFEEPDPADLDEAAFDSGRLAHLHAAGRARPGAGARPSLPRRSPSRRARRR